MNKGSISVDTLIYIIFIVLVVGVIGYSIFQFIFPRVAGNKTAIDTKFKFDKAIVFMNGEKLELKVKTWSDYDGEQIQIITEDGTVYLVSSFNTILIGK